VSSARGFFITRPQPYSPTAQLQQHLAAARHAETIPDTVLFLEHEPTVTLGRRGRTEHLLLSPETLAARGIALHTASRGGDVTYHGPGQLVLYPILQLRGLHVGAHGYLHQLEEIAIRTCASFDIHAFRVAGKNGAWTDAGKLAAIGFHIQRGITLHGMSFNVAPDLTGFSTIVPCGLHGDPVCSLHTLLGDRAPDLATVRAAMAEHVQTVLQKPLALQTIEDRSEITA
jgi:lipoyl(octanoyl) transferase